MYGTQAIKSVTVLPKWFENDVKMYGTQAAHVGARIGDGV